jgi:hypothetical protein
MIYSVKAENSILFIHDTKYKLQVKLNFCYQHTDNRKFIKDRINFL